MSFTALKCSSVDADRPAIDRMDRFVVDHSVSSRPLRTTQAVRSRSRGALRAQVDPRRIEKQLQRRAAIHMHLLMAPPVMLDVEQHRREGTGDGGGGEQDPPHQLDRLGPAARSDGADVPEDRPAEIEIGGADQQQPPAPVFLRDRGHHRLVHVALDQAVQRRGIGQRLAEQHGADAVAEDQHVAGRDFGEDLAQRRVVVRAKEGEGRDQRAGRDAGDKVEGRPPPRCRPAHHQPGTEGAVVSTARQREQVRRRQPPARRDRQRRHLAVLRGQPFARQRRGIAIEPEARVGQAEDGQRLGRRERRRVEPRDRPAAHHRQDNGRHQPQAPHRRKDHR